MIYLREGEAGFEEIDIIIKRNPMIHARTGHLSVFFTVHTFILSSRIESYDYVTCNLAEATRLLPDSNPVPFKGMMVRCSEERNA